MSWNLIMYMAIYITLVSKSEWGFDCEVKNHNNHKNLEKKINDKKHCLAGKFKIQFHCPCDQKKLRLWYQNEALTLVIE